MIKGIYAAASAMIANMDRQTILSHNISNVDTPGFKTIMVSLDDWINTSVVPQIIDGQAGGILSAVIPFLDTDQVSYLGELGLGVESKTESMDFTQGSLQVTDETYDFAIEGDGMFRIMTPDGERYTRDGRFIRDSAGMLVTADGYYVLDTNGQPIQITGNKVEVDTSGIIQMDGEVLSQIGLADFESPQTDLIREPSDLYAAVADPIEATNAHVRQGALEMSNVNIAEMMTKMVTVGRSYEAAQKMVTAQDSLLGKAIAVLGKV